MTSTPVISASDTATLEFLATRRSVPAHLLAGPGPAGAELERLLTIAARVPDHGRLVPWRFLVIEGEARQRIGRVIADTFLADNPDAAEGRVKTEETRLSRAPLVIGVVSRAGPHAKIPEWEQVLSAGAVCFNLSVAAFAMGYAASWLTEWFAYDRRVLDVLGVGPEEKIAGFVHIGRPMEKMEDRPRPIMSDIVSRV